MSTVENNKKIILILAANPKDTDSLRLDEEVRAINEELDRAKQREHFEIKQCWAARPRDVQRAMLKYKPHIVHFCGHSEGDEGIIFENESGLATLVTGIALANLFKLFKSVECVLLNACYSEVQAEAITEYITYVVGMNQAIGDTAAIEFAGGFYLALGGGETIEFAFQFGKVAIEFMNLDEQFTPELWVKGKRIETKKYSSKKIKETDNRQSKLPTVEVIKNQARKSELNQYKAGDAFRSKIKVGIAPEMVVIPRGQFRMGALSGNGSGNEEPVHLVILSYEFAMAKYPVTFVEYDQFCSATGREKPKYKGRWRSKHPVINVSWYNSIAYCEWLSEQTGNQYRLPSEAEWEYCCRAGTETEYWSGNTENDLDKVGWYCENSNMEIHPVGNKPANPFGLCDMHGNVWEWCLDSWHENYKNAPLNGNAWIKKDTEQRVLRGGAFNYHQYNIRSAVREYNTSDWSDDSIGFRVILSPLPLNDKLSEL